MVRPEALRQDNTRAFFSLKSATGSLACTWTCSSCATARSMSSRPFEKGALCGNGVGSIALSDHMNCLGSSLSTAQIPICCPVRSDSWMVSKSP